jgi:threonylcarbamoyladenosine tRNA methylthiotransferase MtaB
MKVFLDAVGCRLNQAEIENMARWFRAAGHEIVAAAECADLAVVNTCSVTAEAASDSRGKIRRLARLGNAQIVATGCWTTLEPEQAAGLPHVSLVVPNDLKDRLVNDLLRIPERVMEGVPGPRAPLPGMRKRTRAFIKVQDGCDNRCTFCATTIARGESRSLPMADVIADVRDAIRGGAKEVVLTGVHLGSWGHDSGMRLADLVRAVLCRTDAPRLRLSSLEPWDLDESFFEMWEDRRLCRHFHLPLQSGCASTLTRMGRKTTPAAFKVLVAAAREVVPDAAITTDLIAGFPGESESDFLESLDFVQEMRFAGGHTFTYSPMAGTVAAGMCDQVEASERRNRNQTYHSAVEAAARAFRIERLGETHSVLWESASRGCDSKWTLSGLTDNYVRVTATSDVSRWNEIDEVTLCGETSQGLYGTIIGTG